LENIGQALARVQISWIAFSRTAKMIFGNIEVVLLNGEIG
jgi:hypothetical protein